MNAGQQNWVKRLSAPANPGLRLLCFPHAGAGVSIYRKWPDLLPTDIELWGVQLPGREARFRDVLVDSAPPIVAAVAAEFPPAPELPFALFGHSMGALLAFETARILRRDRGLLPVCLAVSGNRPPHLQEQGPRTFDLPKAGFLEALRRMNGMPPEMLDSPEWRDLLIPILRADLRVCQTYRYTPAAPLGCPIAAFGGMDDVEAPPEVLSPWGEHTTARFHAEILPGGHFYLQTSEARFLETLSAALREAAESRASV